MYDDCDERMMSELIITREWKYKNVYPNFENLRNVEVISQGKNIFILEQLYKIRYLLNIFISHGFDFPDTQHIQYFGLIHV